MEVTTPTQTQTMTDAESNIDDESLNEYERKCELIRQRELTDEETERIANATGQKDSRDRYERKVVPVSIESDGTVDVGSVRRIAGNESVQWNDKVVGTFGAGGETEAEVRRAFNEAKARWINGIHYDEELAREFSNLE